MDGSAALAQLAELLRLGAETGRQIARFRPRDAADIEDLAVRAEGMAREIDAIARRGLETDGAIAPPRPN